ncbi:MAG: tripartite tricarboxylate transporter substrate binding protein [Candidatus Protistobacter heckmanni]|nr:tripartite tricarboxylate transporter substrate binding protein [Candidatus Protistobacter heckmanni]
MLFEGQGGAMGFGKGSAAVTLAEAAGGTELRYTANAQVGGKLAQVGARLIDSVARKLSDDFFVAFGKQFATPEAAAQPAAAKPAQVSAAGASANAPANPQAGAQASAPAEAGAPASLGASVMVPGWWLTVAATDIVARLLAERLTPITGYNYIVDNRPGQGGSLALGVLAKSPPDGNTMMLAHMSAMCANPHLYKSVPYDSLKDFEAAGLVGDLPFVLVCNPSIPAQTLPELIAYAKANPGKLTNGSSGNGTVSHLTMEEFKRKAGVDIVHIPYKGSSQNLADVVGGTVSIALETAPAVQAFVQSGKLRALAAGTSKRLAAPLAVPTLAEYGITGINAVTWLMLMYPSGTAKPMIHSTFEAANNIVRSPQVVQRFAQLGVLPRSSASPEEAAAYIRSEYAAWGAIVKRSGTTLD